MADAEARRSAIVPPAATVWSIGHSTRAFPEFVDLLREHRVARLADVRHFPSSERVPWTNRAALDRALREIGIEYVHLEALGGYRTARPDSPNTGWRSAGFRGYADHMDDPGFQRAVEALLLDARERRTAVMCAEAVPWRCHRSLLADALVARGARVVHILGPGSTQDHRLTPFARVRGGRVTYPAPKGKRLKRTRA
ncbi:MAG TPA: DUF488 domain-containing protein [Thermoplasmata archaeon]|nr:DUF488 domain-containing protein [Thermoplasmata archaeon]